MTARQTVTIGLACVSHMNCPRCFGRGYVPEKRKPSRRNPNALGFYARTCRRCGGSGEKPLAACMVREYRRLTMQWRETHVMALVPDSVAAELWIKAAEVAR